MSASSEARWPPDGLERPSAYNGSEKAEDALDAFDQWLLNGEAFSMETMKPAFTVREDRRYRFRFRNASVVNYA